MANGKPFHQAAMTCATNDWPLGTRLRVRAGTRSVVVIVTDRGPSHKLYRVIDLSKAAFIELRPLSKGLVTVEVTALP